MNLVTGATGLVGYSVVASLLGRGERVRALVRDPGKGARLLPPAVEIVAGDVTDRASLDAAVRDCRTVYHAAGLPEQWLPDVRTFEHVNVGGTTHVVDAVRSAKVERLVYTSTIDVFAAAPGTEFDESVLDPNPKGTPYERSKQAADRVVAGAVAGGLDAVFIHPAAVYGPGPAGSPGINQMVTDLRDGKVPALLPGGMPVVFGPDLGDGHVRARTQGAPGSRYILAERFYSLVDLSRAILDALGRADAKPPPIVPLWAAKLMSTATESISRLSGRPPLLPKGQLHFLQWGARPQSARAHRDLGWTPTPLREGLAATVAYLGAR